jgi:hypothetical protein
MPIFLYQLEKEDDKGVVCRAFDAVGHVASTLGPGAVQPCEYSKYSSDQAYIFILHFYR